MTDTENKRLDELYEAAVQKLFESAPLFQQIGGGAYKEGLHNTHLLDEHYGHPHKSYRTLHVAGTNGKGSCAHTLAAVLQSAGYRTGLYTSPHLVDFRERIRVNGEMMPKQRVVDFVAHDAAFYEPLHPSFFELTTALAFKYFEEQGVDVAVIEVGLGGRLDCTNIITPDLCVITNISFDHTQFLGNTLKEIAAEKAGIMKKGVPVVIGEALPQTAPVFRETAKKVGCPIFFAEEERHLLSAELGKDGVYDYVTAEYGPIKGELVGAAQVANTRTILSALSHLPSDYYRIPRQAVAEGFGHVTKLTGLMGRWQVMSRHPLVVCDTGHNAGGWTYLAEQLRTVRCRKLHVVFGMVADKDVDSVLNMLPHQATYYFTRASVRRALPVETLEKKARLHGLEGVACDNVADAFRMAQAAANEDDMIFVGGSSFVVADFLVHLRKISD